MSSELRAPTSQGMMLRLARFSRLKVTVSPACTSIAFHAPIFHGIHPAIASHHHAVLTWH